MTCRRVLLRTVSLFVLVPVSLAVGQQPGPAPAPTIQVTSRLVFLDVTVLDKKGRPVVKGLTRDDFQITEEKRPQTIFSFEAPAEHAREGAGNAEGEAPRTIFVLDQLNSSFEDFAYIRWEAERYLEAQPRELAAPAELMVAGNESLDLVQSYTRDRGELLDAVKHLPAVIPYKQMAIVSFWPEQFVQSIDALRQIALENRGTPGRKIIVWVGHGSPAVMTRGWPSHWIELVDRYIHDTTNMLVDGRISLFVIYPGLPVKVRYEQLSETDALATIGEDDPFAGDINFGVFVNETGGKLFYNRNDVDAEMLQSVRMGSEYYTLTYQPHGGDDNGRFRRIRVTVRDPNLRVVTKAGYYAPDRNAQRDPRQEMLANLLDAVRATLPFSALDVRLEGVVRHPDAHTAEFMLRLEPTNLGWLSTEDGHSSARVMLAGASLSGTRDILASRVAGFTVTDDSQDSARIAAGKPFLLKLTVRLPRRTQSVRLVVDADANGRIAAINVDRKTVDAAPAAPTPAPVLGSRPGAGL